MTLSLTLCHPHMVSHLHSDRPITQDGDDAFGRRQFINTLYEEIRAIPDTESIVIGLAGSWGSGKTSVVNLLCNKLLNDRKNRSLKPNDTIIVRFNPWNQISTEKDSGEYFVNSFFDSIRKQLWEDKDDWYINPDNLQDLTDAIEEYTALLKPGLMKASILLTTRISKKKLLKQMDTITSAKQRVKHALGDFGIKILVVIDDIDRLPLQQIQLIFQLITIIADFESVNYLIAYDKNAVSEALKKIQGLSGDDYLEKVIQVPINMPDISTASMNAIITKRLNFIPNFYYAKPDEIEEASERFSLLLPLLQQSIRTGRQLHRLENALRFKLPLLTDKIDAIDLLAIEHLCILAPESMHWIALNASILCVDINPNANIVPIDQEDWEGLEDSYCQLACATISPTLAIQIIDFLFKQPRRAFYEDNRKSYDAHLERRIMDPSIFEYYLTSDPSAGTYVADTLRSTINTMKSDALSQSIRQSIQENGYLETIESLASLESNLDAEELTLAVTAFAENIQYADRSSPTFSENTRTIDIIESLLLKTDESKRDSYVVNLFNSLDCVSVAFLAEFIIRRDRVYKRNRFEGGHSYKQIVSENCVEQLEHIFVAAMDFLASHGRLNSLAYLYPQMALWRNADNIGFRIALDGIKQDPTRLILFAESFVSPWTNLETGEISSFSISYEILEYATQAELMSAAEELDFGSILLRLPQSTQQKTTALYIALKHNRLNGNIGEEIELDEIIEQLNIWLKTHRQK